MNWWDGDKTGRDPGRELNELRRAVAELLGADSETWPDHGNAPLAIAAAFANRGIYLRDALTRAERLEAIVAALLLASLDDLDVLGDAADRKLAWQNWESLNAALEREPWSNGRHLRGLYEEVRAAVNSFLAEAEAQP